MLKIVVCVSGGGSNLQAIIDGMKAGEVTNAKIVGVLSNNLGVKALDRAENNQIPSATIMPKDYETRQLFHDAMMTKIKEWNPDYIVLAGFLVKIPVEMIEAYPNRIINVHPSLIPAFCGTGFYGLKVHEKVLEKGVKITGATVHFVDAGMDTGLIIDQKAVRVEDEDTPKVLQQRVMEEAEWNILPKVIHDLANGKIEIIDNKVKHRK